MPGPSTSRPETILPLLSEQPKLSISKIYPLPSAPHMTSGHPTTHCHQKTNGYLQTSNTTPSLPLLQPIKPISLIDSSTPVLQAQLYHHPIISFNLWSTTQALFYQMSVAPRVLELLSSYKLKTASGPDGVSSRMLRENYLANTHGSVQLVP